jgi:L-fuconolactonase
MKQAIVDSHIHFWDPDYLSYPWLSNVTAINAPYLPADLEAAASQVDLQGIVFVEADCRPDQRLAEAQWVADLAKDEPRIRGIVASAPLEDGAAVRSHLEALARIPLVKGVRRLLQSEDLEFAVQPKFVEGVRMLADYGFSFDLCIYHPHLESVIRLVDQCPQVSFVLDHFGKPDVKDEVHEPWREQLRTLAGFPHVQCKISGLATEADHRNWTREQLRSYIEHAIAVFGPDRVIYGGDWPVSTLAIGYQQWIDTINWATPHLDDAARTKLFVENAEKFYRLR